MVAQKLLCAPTIGRGSARPGGSGGGSQRSQISLPSCPECIIKAPKRPVSCSYWLKNCWKRCFLLYNIQCAPHKLSPLIFIIASSTEIAATWNFFCVCGLPLCWCWRFFIILKQNLFVWRAFLREKKKTVATSQASFLFFARKLAKQEVFALA